MDFTGNLAVITGAANGIGKAIAERCAKYGANCALLDIDATKLALLEREFQSKYPQIKTYAFVCDVTNLAQYKEVVQEIERTFGTNKIQLLFNNVGIASLVPTLTGEIEKLHKIMDLNLWSMIYGTRLFLPLLLNNKNNEQCYIINTGSIASIEYSTSMYGISKHAVLAFTEVMTKEINLMKKKTALMKCDIHCACLCPAFVDTQIMLHSAQALDLTIDEVIVREKKRGLNFVKQQAMVAQTRISTDECMDVLFRAMKEKRGVIHTHPEWVKAVVSDRFECILNGTPHKAKAMKKAIKERMQRNQSKL